MRTLLQTLNETDEAVLATIATTWGLAERPNDKKVLAEQLEAIMLDTASAERLWDSLPDDQRQALQTVLGGGGSMMMSMFKHMFGDIRKMGRGGVEREQPHVSPTSPAEALFYKGFVGETIRIGNNGSQAMVYVPDDLALVLPSHKTGYDNLESEEPDPLSAVDARQLTETRPADTSIVDDMTALLAFAQLHTPPIEGDSLAEGSLRALMPYLLVHGTERVAFLVAVGMSMDLLALQAGRAVPNRNEARGWLAAPRSEQIEQLIRAWLDSEYYRELHHIGELEIERTDSYDPRLARRVLQKAIAEAVPAADWWELDELVHIIKENVPDFQRPNGDYDSWYILDRMSGDYLRGFESWDMVEAPLLEYIIMGPMHWLGLVDVAPGAAKLTAYGRGVAGAADFPTPPDAPEPIRVEDDGTLVVSRKVSRLDRFQVARFTSWAAAPPLGSDAAFRYVIDRAGVAQADAQDIQTDHISAFLKRILGDDPIPERIERVLANWRGGDDTSTVTLTQMVVLQTTSNSVMDELVDTPEIRRYLGRRLGERAVAVRADQWVALREALAAMGFGVEGMG